MGAFSPLHWLIALGILAVPSIAIIWGIYRHGKKVGDSQGYMRGYKEGQESAKK
jgi:hypothetical protein